MARNGKDPIHPGEQLADELEEIGINGLQLANMIGLPHNRVYEILRGERSITASTALRLGKFFDMNPEFWLNLQKKYDLEMARKLEDKELKSIKPYKKSKPSSHTGVNL